MCRMHVSHACGASVRRMHVVRAGGAHRCHAHVARPCRAHRWRTHVARACGVGMLRMHVSHVSHVSHLLQFSVMVCNPWPSLAVGKSVQTCWMEKFEGHCCCGFGTNTRRAVTSIGRASIGKFNKTLKTLSFLCVIWENALPLQFS